ncbi:MAG: F-type H+-transporting ATPase subunit delta, partial [Verrucomicrobiota bacterium]
RRDAKQLFQACKVNGVLDEGRARLTVQAVIAKKPRGYVAILSHFERLVKIDFERRTARVESATPLTGAMESSLRTSLAQRYGPGLNVSFTQNPALLGGLRVQIGSDVFDGSVQARLNALAESF